MTSAAGFGQRLSHWFDAQGYVFGSRVATHVLFWLLYYLSFSLIWANPEKGYFGSFYLEFVLLPVRILAAYALIYVLFPRYLLQKRFGHFFATYLLLLAASGLLYRFCDYFFYDRLYLGQATAFFQFSEWLRNILLINTTVVVVGAIRLLKLLFVMQQQVEQTLPRKIEIKANRRTHLVDPARIVFIEGMGNYTTYYLDGGEKLVAYGTIKSALQSLPSQFVRLHRSYVVNKDHIESFNSEDVTVAHSTLPRGKEVSDDLLMPGA
ncbi:LytTR family DNA-binding domain-containing protein [Porticoccus sp. W117]|uniref:LytR/AlgR family response regulator transcription factor n=1 Tax=Porticoccus sp. W117 TaxID=3054777 RepID=UPI002593E4E2|nr:LytTR family DNA-binding domain-containing protein [Porticoccus sp. W117]MDM3870875.1 LytTR family DNA-binding domain-containing protein [Porticoccus sp. W117]